MPPIKPKWESYEYNDKLRSYPKIDLEVQDRLNLTTLENGDVRLSYKEGNVSLDLLSEERGYLEFNYTDENNQSHAFKSDGNQEFVIFTLEASEESGMLKQQRIPTLLNPFFLI